MSDITERELSFLSNGRKLYVKEFMPGSNTAAKKGKMPAVIVSHGFGGSARDVECYCATFSQMGYVAYCFDFCGGSIEGMGRSEGTSLDMTIGTECTDLNSVIGQIKKFPYVDACRISLMGCSQGGFVSALVAAELGSAIENLIMFYPALCIPDHARAGKLGGASYDVRHVPEIIECPNQMKLSQKFHKEVYGMDPYLEISKYKGRVLLVQGMEDNVVNYAYAVRAKESYDKGQCSLMMIRDAGHGFNGQQDESAVIAIEHFLAGKRELLTIQVVITGSKMIAEKDGYRECEVSFTGYCDNDLFQGSILPKGVDVQKQYGDGAAVLRAEYTLVGRDYEMNACSIHIVNQKKGSRYKPTVTTDSKALAYLNDLDMTASLEGFPGGLTVRVFG